MTINDFKNKVNSFNVNSFAKLSIFDNRNQVVEAVRTSWNSSETPSGTSWRPGIYEVKMFAGSTWKVTGTFRILGDEIDVGSVPTAIGSPLPDVLTVTSTPEPPTN